MHKIGIPENLIEVFKQMYEDNSLGVKTGNGISARLTTSEKLLHGYVTSSTLLKIFVEYALKAWQNKCQEMVILIRNELVHELIFADDQLVLVQYEKI